MLEGQTWLSTKLKGSGSARRLADLCDYACSCQFLLLVCLHRPSTRTALQLIVVEVASYGPLNPPRKFLVCLHICFVGRNLERLHPGDASGSLSGTVFLRLKITLARKSGAKKRVFAQPTNSVAPLEDIRCSTKVSFLSFCCFS